MKSPTHSKIGFRFIINLQQISVRERPGAPGELSDPYCGPHFPFLYLSFQFLFPASP